MSHQFSTCDMTYQAPRDLEGADSDSEEEVELLHSPRELGPTSTGAARRRFPLMRPAAFLGGGVLGLLAVMAVVSRLSHHYGAQQKRAGAKLSSSVSLSEYSNNHDNNVHDGNVCEDDEELFGQLCYKMCSKLTDGAYPIRTTAMTCCAAHPCGLLNQKHDAGFCSGFSVAGGARGACPHAPGACLEDEELLMGSCFKKCKLLTNSVYPFRVGPATCCMEDNEVGCLVPGNGLSHTSITFNVGGGGAVAGIFHPPIKALTEAKNVAGNTWTSTSETATYTTTVTTVTDTTTTWTATTTHTITTTTEATATTTKTGTLTTTKKGAPAIPDWAAGVLADPNDSDVKNQLDIIDKSTATTTNANGPTTVPDWLSDIVEKHPPVASTSQMLPQPQQRPAEDPPSGEAQVVMRKLLKPAYPLVTQADRNSQSLEDQQLPMVDPYYQPSADFFDPAQAAKDAQRASQVSTA